MTAAGSTQGLPRSARLRREQDFRRLRESGHRKVLGTLIANWRILAEGSRSRVGVVAGRKVGPAVVRNRAKRLLREVFRVHQHDLRQPVEAVLVARPSLAGKRFAQVEREVLAVFARAKLLRSP
jgi:ribonuclease P protein component